MPDRLRYVPLIPFCLFGLLLLCPPFLPAREDVDGADKAEAVARLRAHVDYLTSDTCEGRAAGSEGGRCAGDYIAEQLRSFGIQPQFQEFEWNKAWALAGQNDYGTPKHPFRNVIGIIPGSDPALAEETVLLSAHYDHVGREPGGEERIIRGANDNASGTAAVLLVAERLARLPVGPRRTVVLAFWDGEEIALCGSVYYARNPIRPLDQTVFAVTLDMVGDLRDDTLHVVGWRSGPGMRQLLSRSNASLPPEQRLRLAFLLPMWINSDHYPLYRKRIPSMLFFTGFEGPYHHPDDTPDRLSLEGVERIAGFAHAMIQHADTVTRAELPLFRSTRPIAVLTGAEDARLAVEEARAVLGSKPTPGTRERWNREPRFELRTNRDEPQCVIVREVPGDSVFWKAGIRPNDRIYSIDGAVPDPESVPIDGGHTLEVETDGKIRLVPIE